MVGGQSPTAAPAAPATAGAGALPGMPPDAAGGAPQQGLPPPPDKPVKPGEKYMAMLEKEALLFDPDNLDIMDKDIFQMAGKINDAQVATQVIEKIKKIIKLTPTDPRMRTPEEDVGEKPREGEGTLPFTDANYIDYAETMLKALEFNPDKARERVDDVYEYIQNNEITMDNARKMHTFMKNFLSTQPTLEFDSDTDINT